ncbi:hypothetical protein CRENBAI_008412 [Crenichthys baileyi]|uniref:Uncharacterized protein n=1 Tax=Crenichthys baileyi TaxID=28760 RepID=A0AAV9S0X4_9TELE
MSAVASAKPSTSAAASAEPSTSAAASTTAEFPVDFSSRPGRRDPTSSSSDFRRERVAWSGPQELPGATAHAVRPPVLQALREEFPGVGFLDAPASVSAGGPPIPSRPAPVPNPGSPAASQDSSGSHITSQGVRGPKSPEFQPATKSSGPRLMDKMTEPQLAVKMTEPQLADRSPSPVPEFQEGFNVEPPLTQVPEF